MAEGLLSYETFVKAVAGASGSIVAMSVFYPLDTVRFRLQIEDDNANELKGMNSLQAIYHIIKLEGLGALYRGMKPVLQSLGASNFVYFYTFHGLKSIKSGSALNDLGLGMLAGMANVLATLPLWVVNSRLKAKQSEHFSGLLDGMVHIAQKEGVSSLWNGLGPSLMLVVNPAIHFAVYESLKRNFNTSSATVFFLFGAISKTIATVATYPIQLAQARQRHGQNSQMSTAALLLSILKRKGPGALFQGMEAKLLQTVLTAALFFMTYEKIVRFVFMLLMRKKL